MHSHGIIEVPSAWMLKHRVWMLHVQLRDCFIGKSYRFIFIQAKSLYKQMYSSLSWKCRYIRLRHILNTQFCTCLRTRKWFLLTFTAARTRIPSGTVSQRRGILRTIHLSGIRRLWYGKKGSAIRKVVKKEKTGVHAENKKARSLGK